MRFPDFVTIIRPGVDEYGNPGAGWDDPVLSFAKGFRAASQTGDTLFLPKDTDIQPGDRVQIGTIVYAVEAPVLLRSPSRPGGIMWQLALKRVPDDAAPPGDGGDDGGGEGEGEGGEGGS